jgi:NitT/TauT family transport system substrate-binding protein
MRQMILIITSLLVFVLMSCEETSKIQMIVPYGSTQLSQIYMQADKDLYDVDIVMGSDALVSAFASKSHDVIFAPTQLGAIFYDDPSDYRLAATIVWGNLYVISIDTVLTSFSDLAGKSITLFSRHQTPDIIVRYLIEEMAIDIDLSYVDSVSSAIALLKVNPESIVLAAEPVLSVLLETEPAIEMIDLQTVYQMVSGQNSYPQASVFIKPDLSDAMIEMILSDLERSIESTNMDVSESADLAIEMGFNISHQSLIEAIPRSHLMYVDALSAKADVITYFEMILKHQPSLLESGLPDESFYLGTVDS